jgi:uncharacterized protein (TIGR03437 family)
VAFRVRRNVPRQSKANMKLFTGLSILVLTVASGRTLSGAKQTLLRNPDIGNQGVAIALAADGAGNLFTVSAFQDESGQPQIRVIKTDPNGAPLAVFSFLGQGPAQAATDAQGNLVLVGSVTTPLANFTLVNPLFPSQNNGGAYVVKMDSQLKGILFSTFLNTQSAAKAVALDSAGNIYVGGSTTATDFPVTQGSYQIRPPNNDTYGFLAEISPNGDKLLYSTYFGGDASICVGGNPGTACEGVPTSTNVLSLAVGPSGAVVIGGNTTATDLPVTPGVIGPSCECTERENAGFLAEFSPGNLAKLAWSTFVNLGSSTNPLVTADYVFIDAVAFDPAGDLIIGGEATSGLVTTPGALQPALPPNTQYGGFLAKVTSSATGITWSTWFGGGPSDGQVGIGGQVNALALDPQGQIVATGVSQPSQFPPFAASPVVGPSYVARISGDGSTLIDLHAGPLNSAGAALALTPAGNFVSLGSAGSIWIETPATGPSLLAAANAANGPVSGLVAPAEIISLFGLGIGPSTALLGQVTDGVYSSSLEGYQVQFDGIAAPLLYLGPTQINAVVPQAVWSRDYTHVQLVTPSGMVDGPTLAVRQAYPYIFQYSPAVPNGPETAVLAAALNQDGSINSPQNPAAPGQIVTIFVSGGGYNPNFSPPDGSVVPGSGQLYSALLPVAVLSDPLDGSPGTSLEVLYAGDAPLLVLGVMQVNFRLPESLPAPISDVFRFALQVGDTLGGVASVAVSQ